MLKVAGCLQELALERELAEVQLHARRLHHLHLLPHLQRLRVLQLSRRRRQQQQEYLCHPCQPHVQLLLQWHH